MDPMAGDRMTTRRYALAVAASVLVLGQQACGGGDDNPPAGGSPSSETVAPPASAEPSVEPSPSASASASTPQSADPLSGKRQLIFVPLVDGKEQAGSVISVTPAGRADVTNRDGDTALFVPVETRPGSGRYLLKTGKLVKGGEPYCLQVKANGSNPLTVVTQACDAGKINQQFRFQRLKGAYLISSDGVYLTWRPKAKFGLIAEESGEGDDLTSWRLRDRGAAGIPGGN
jgi:hypothetical protein